MSERSKQQRIKDPITIDDYKLLNKALKLKIVKQSKIIDELEQDAKSHLGQITELRKKSQLNRETPQSLLPKTQPNRSEINVNTLIGRKQVMNAFTRSVLNFGISPQAIFRIIDIEMGGEIDSETFRNAISKMNIQLSPKEISCLIYVFDENCTGTITRQQFVDALQAYQASSETGHAFYLTHSINKLANLLHQSNTSLKKFYDEMQGKGKKAVTLDVFGQHIKAVFQDKILEKEIVGAFNHLDLQKNGTIDRQNFLYGVQSSLNKQHNDHIKKSQEDFGGDSNQQSNNNIKKPMNNMFESILSNNKSGKKFFEQEIVNDLLQQHKESAINIKVPVSEINIMDLFQKFLREYKLDINKIYEEVTLLPLDRRLTLFSFRKAINESARLKANISEVNPESISSLFKLIDVNQKGSLGISELICFYLENGSDLSLVFRLIGKYFKREDLNAQRFFYTSNLNPDSDISQSRFLEIMSKQFNIGQPNPALWQKVWAYFDKGRGVQSVAFIIKEMEKYQIQ